MAAVSTPTGEITLGIGLGFVSVALGVLSLVVKSECQTLELCWGMVKCTKGAPPPEPHRATEVVVGDRTPRRCSEVACTEV